jgi:hypothetical protein
MTSLATISLMQVGVKNPRNHIIIVRQLYPEATWGVGTILVSKEPFSDEALNIIEEVARSMRFDIILSPRFALDSTFTAIASGNNLDGFMATFPINITAPTDDKPFFFHMLWLRDMFNRKLWNLNLGGRDFNRKAIFILGALLITVIGLTFLCIIVPLILTTRKSPLKGASPLFLYFACIGFGFMLVEISQMERLIVFLGHPTYGLSVVLFSLLLSSGLGSYSTERISAAGNRSMGTALNLLMLLCALIIFGILTPYAIRAFQGSITILRILVSVGILSILGLFMGMAFPLGMKMASIRSDLLTPWLGGINGATSVCASVFAVAIALNSGISATFWTGFSCYVVAFFSYIWTIRGNKQTSQP